MKEPSANFVTKGEFRLVAFSLAALLVAAVVLLRPLARKVELVEGGRGKVTITGTGGKNSPIVVIGGAMTAFTTGADKWLPKDTSALSYCVDADTSYIEFDNEANPALSEVWSDPTTSHAFTPWKVDVYGHLFHSAGSSGNGLEFVSRMKGTQPVNCEDQPGMSVVVSLINNHGEFYPPKSLPTDTNHTSNLRFLDSYQTTGCKGGDSAGRNDQDVCERIAEVDVTIKGVLQPQCKCIDGDCSVAIGKPQ